MAVLFFLFLNMLFYSTNCEQSEILPLGDIISSVADITNAITSNQKEGSINDAVTDSLPKINLKIVPSKKLHITKMTPAEGYSTFAGYAHLSSGLIVGLSSLVCIEIIKKRKKKKRRLSFPPFALYNS
ncbi:hypothetical protein PFNF54_01034 [Plasmodium falciparum NF54]|uniref:Uncharacterized protein n=1 Tax=Plasmodium falciparum (isolate NF54) TaxID=5843 RepID=W7JZT5_PLAFO|nr:hypothetical protein PFNF54_01034 [Plasmodium falciparum NF54]